MKDIPEFHHDVPRPMWLAATEMERYQLELQSVAKQQNAWIIQRLVDGDARMDKADDDRKELKRVHIQVAEDLKKEQIKISLDLDARIKPFELLRERLSGKWSVITFIATIIAIPLAMLIAGAIALRATEKWWK